MENIKKIRGSRSKGDIGVLFRDNHELSAMREKPVSIITALIEQSELMVHCCLSIAPLRNIDYIPHNRLYYYANRKYFKCNR
jgi:hypothetical protein